MKNLIAIVLLFFIVSICAQTKENITKEKYEISTNSRAYLENFDTDKIIQHFSEIDRGKTVQIKFTYTDKTKKGSRKKSFEWKGMSLLVKSMKNYFQEQIKNLYVEEVAE